MSTLQCPRREQVVGREQHHIVAGGFGQAFVVGGDVSAILLVPAEAHARVGAAKASGNLGRVVARMVVDDKDPHFDAGLVKNALYARL